MDKSLEEGVLRDLNVVQFQGQHSSSLLFRTKDFLLRVIGLRDVRQNVFLVIKVLLLLSFVALGLHFGLVEEEAEETVSTVV